MRVRRGKEEAIGEITRRLVEFYRPVRIYLFDSEARGDAGPDSDLDFLVVVPDDLSRERLIFRARVPKLRVVEPDRTIMFGSAATGETTKDSDIDLLIVQRKTAARHRESVVIGRRRF